MRRSRPAKAGFPPSSVVLFSGSSLSNWNNGYACLRQAHTIDRRIPTTVSRQEGITTCAREVPLSAETSPHEERPSEKRGPPQEVFARPLVRK